MNAGDHAPQSSRKEKLVHVCRRHAAAQEWSDIILKTEDRALLTKEPQLVMQRLYAALMLSSEELVKEMFARVLESGVPVGIKLSAVKEFATYKHPVEAALILLTDTAVQSDPRFINATKHVFVTLKDEDLRLQLKQAVSKFCGGGDQIKPKRSEVQFAKQPENAIWGSVTLTASPTTRPHHAKILDGDALKFKDTASAGRQPVVSEYSNVFTDPAGQIWTEKGELIASRGLPLSTLDRSKVDNIAVGFAANRGTRGIYHWLIDYLPRFSWIADSDILHDQNFKILLNGNNPGFEYGSLDLIGLSAVTLKLTGTVFVERLLVAPVSFRGMVGWRHLDSVFETLCDQAIAQADKHGIVLPERIYITRRDADRRVLTNEGDIETLARARSFEVQEFSNLPLWHQIALARRAKIIMAPHGAGLSHIVFARPGTTIIELLPIKDGAYALRFNYARLSVIKGHTYKAWLEEQYPLVNAWTIDLSAFEAFLDSTLGNESAFPIVETTATDTSKAPAPQGDGTAG